MKKHGSLHRLIRLNKTIIFLSAIVVIISLFSLFLIKEAEKETLFAKIIGSLNLFVFTWTAINTFLFVRIFYGMITYVDKPPHV